MSDTALGSDQYSQALHGAHSVRLLASSVAGRLDLDAAIAAIDEADTSGADAEPTLFRGEATSLHENRRVLAAVRDLAALSARGAGA